MAQPVAAAPLAAELERAKQREQALAFDRNEAALAAPLAGTLTPKQELSGEQRQLFDRFAKWCEQLGVRKCAAKPVTVAAFVLAQADLGVPDDQILGALAAITAVHDYHGLPNPTATAIVKAALDRAIKIGPPRSWSKADKALFATLPADIRRIIERRETERDNGLRKKQNELAEKDRNNGKKNEAA